VSGIAGLFYLNGRRAQAQSAETMIRAMPHRCRDGSHAAADGPAALAHGALHTLAEDRNAVLPLQMERCLITADARLDNRPELIAALGLAVQAESPPCEAELIGRAYLKWGEQCVERLLGDFAFAIWDPRRRVLLCARDHFGAKPLCYYKSDRLFAFGSEPKAVLALAEVPREINEEYICYHFYPDLLRGDPAITSHRGILRLELAHRITISKGAVEKQRYWQPDLDRESDCRSDEEHFEKFRHLFFQAVEARLRTSCGLGSALSGGLDSSSIVCAARDILGKAGRRPLKTYSALFNDVPSADERRWINAIVESGGIEAHTVHPDEDTPLVDIETLFWLFDGPFYGTNYFIHWHMYRAAARHGVRVLLDGEDGDTVVSHGSDQLTQLVQANAWESFAAECEAVERNFDNRTFATKLGMLRLYGLPQLRCLSRRGSWGSFLRGVSLLHRHFHVPRRRLLIDCGVKPWLPVAAIRRALGRSSGQPHFEDGILRQELAQKYRLRERLAEFNAGSDFDCYPTHPRRTHYGGLASPTIGHALEWYDRIASWWGIEVRHPFCDPRLAEFCLSVPPELKLRNGLSRYILREALAGTVPDAVRLRGGKGDLSAVSERGLRRFESAYLNSVPERAKAYGTRFMDPAGVESAVRSFVSSEGSEAATMRVWQAATLTRWLDTEYGKQTLEMGSQSLQITDLASRGTTAILTSGGE